MSLPGGISLTGIGYVELVRDGGSYSGVFETSSPPLLLSVLLRCVRGAPLPADSLEPAHEALFVGLEGETRLAKGSPEEIGLLQQLRKLLASSTDDRERLAELIASIEQRSDPP